MENEDGVHGALPYKPPSLLPIARHRRSLLYIVETYQVTIVVAATGSGKSTQIPQFLQQAGWTSGGRMIAVTQPRRVAAVTVAQRVAEEQRCAVGEAIGYSIRFEDRTSEETRIKFMTDGLLLREALVDPLLSRYSVIMVDEAHERSLSTDVLLGILKKILRKRPELRVIISSATLEADSMLDFFLRSDTSAKPLTGRIMQLDGRSYPVDILYRELPCPDYVAAAVQTVAQVHASEPPGDILLFLTGRDEIERTQQLLVDRNLSKVLVVLMFAGLTAEEQLAAFEQPPDWVRKVVLATNIAEASITIDGIVYVVDCGFVKLRAYQPASGIDRLAVTAVSQASANQRAGRAGRTRAGKCFRLYTQAAFKALPPVTPPEIQRSNLAPVMLELKALGIDNIVRFDFLTPPPAALVARALELLFALGALDDHAKLTRPLGWRMAEMAVEPMLSKAILEASRFQCQAEMLSIAAMLSLQGDVWVAEGKGANDWRHKFATEEGDHLTLLNVYQAFTTTGRSEVRWCKNNGLNYQALSRAVRVRSQLQRYLERLGQRIDSPSRDEGLAERVRRCLTTGFFAHAARMQPDGTFQTVNGTVMHAHPSSLMFNRKADWVVFNEVLETKGKMYLRDISKIEKAWLLEYAPHYYRRQ